MTVAVTGVEAFGHEVDEPGTSRFEQVLILYFTAANSDVNFNVGQSVTGSLGTFWTQALADATYGNTGALALRLLQAITPLIKNFIGSFGGALASNPPSSVAFQANVPNLTFPASSAPTAGALIFKFDMKPGKPVKWPIVP